MTEGEEANNKSFGIRRKVLVATVILFVFVTLITTGCTKNNNDISISSTTDADIEAELERGTSVDNSALQDEKGMINIGDDGINAGIASDNAIKEDFLASSRDRMVDIAVANSGRADPFLPFAESGSTNKKVERLPYVVLPPLEEVQTDSNAEKILTTKVSGIMYDNTSPSAILNIQGTDYLVRSGDVINNYKVLSIGKTVVTVQLGQNIYRAGVGQILTNGNVQYNEIANLQNKFGGSRK